MARTQHLFCQYLFVYVSKLSIRFLLSIATSCNITMRMALLKATFKKQLSPSPTAEEYNLKSPHMVTSTVSYFTRNVPSIHFTCVIPTILGSLQQLQANMSSYLYPSTKTSVYYSLLPFSKTCTYFRVQTHLDK